MEIDTPPQAQHCDAGSSLVSTACPLLNSGEAEALVGHEREFGDQPKRPLSLGRTLARSQACLITTPWPVGSSSTG
jgi:hypothetical protein